jgi:predicted HTH transcriptional regulator
MMDSGIAGIIEAGEGYHTEFKQSLDRSFIEEVCAFANSGGGRVIIGVSDKGVVKGVPADNSLRSKVQDTLRQLQPNLDVRIRFEGEVMIEEVPEGNEKVGTGINRIRQAVEENGKSSVDFDFNSGFSVIFRKLGGKPDVRLGEKLGENQSKIIREIENNPQISIAELSRKIGLSTTTIENNISKLNESGHLKRIGPDKGGYWEVTDQSEK